jgi:hypothetical protein
MPFDLDLDNLPPLLRESDICRDPKRGYPGILPMTRSAFRTAVEDGYINKPIKLGAKVVAWRREDILDIVRNGVVGRREQGRRARAREEQRRAVRGTPSGALLFLLLLIGAVPAVAATSAPIGSRWSAIWVGAGMVIVRNFVPIAANHIVGLVDIIIPHEPWRFVFRRCRWFKDGAGERIEAAEVHSNSLIMTGRSASSSWR